MCRVEDFTLSALETEIQERMHVGAKRQILNEVHDDTCVESIFKDAIGKDSYAAIIVTDTVENDCSIEPKQISCTDLICGFSVIIILIILLS